MSPGGRTDNLYTGGFPRVSGDEPDALLSVYPDQRFSPRERG